MTRLTRLTWSVLAFGAAAAVFVGCGDDKCENITGPSSVQFTLDDDAGVRFDVADEPLRVEHLARMRFRSVGPTDGLLIWSWRGDLRADCKSAPPDSDSSCSTLVDVERGRSFQLGLLGSKQGDYDLEGALYDYKGPESYFEEPICRVHSSIKVRAH